MAGRSKLRPNGPDSATQRRYVYRRALRRATPSTADDKRAELEKAILLAAEEEFAKNGFRGTSLEQIAASAGLSKQNMLYYFPTKSDLYNRVLQSLLDGWLGSLEVHLGAGCDPREGVPKYVAEKLRFSRARPAGSRLYAMELISGAPHFSDAISSHVAPRSWAAANILASRLGGGPDASLDAIHTVFLLWAMTQTYADFSAQMELVLGRRLAENDFIAVERLISTMVSSLFDRP